MSERATIQCRRCRLFVDPRLSWAKGDKVQAVCPECGRLIEYLDPTGALLKKLGPKPAPGPPAVPATLFDSTEDVS
jgi:hypothetical protein